MSFGLVGAILGMSALTFLIFPVTLFARINSVRSGKMKANAFKLVELTDAPEIVKKSTRQWSNIFEVPTLFYALSLLCLFLNLNDPLFGILAWAFVIARCGHSIVHLSYNKVSHRLFFFVASNIFLVIFFLRLCFKTL